MKVPVSSIIANPAAIRAVDVESPSFIELRDSIENKGLLQPLLVRKYETENFNGYAIVAGNTRFTAISQLHQRNSTLFAEVEVVVTDASSEEEFTLLALTENLQRTNMTVRDIKAAVLSILKARPTASLKDIASTLNKSPEFVTKILSIVKIQNDGIQALIDSEAICLTNAAALATLSPDEQEQFLEDAKILPASEFTVKVAQYRKAKQAQIKSGKDASGVVEFKAEPRMRRADIMLRQRELGCADVISAVKSTGVTDVDSIVKAVFDWVCQMDAESVAVAKADHDAKEAAKAEKKQQREAEAHKKSVEKLAADPKAIAEMEARIAEAKAAAGVQG